MVLEKVDRVHSPQSDTYVKWDELQISTYFKEMFRLFLRLIKNATSAMKLHAKAGTVLTRDTSWFHDIQNILADTNYYYKYSFVRVTAARLC